MAPEEALRVLCRAVSVGKHTARPLLRLNADGRIGRRAETTADVVMPTSWLETPVVPEPGAGKRLARELLTAHEPMLLVGDGVAASGAQEEKHALSELIGAPIWPRSTAPISVISIPHSGARSSAA